LGVSFPSHSLSPAELASLLEAERAGFAFLAYRDDTGDLRLAPLDGAGGATVGRGEHNDVVLAWDPEVSRTHAQLELVGGEWTLVDDGLSRNGSFVNGERLVGRCRLADGDVLRIGRSSLVFRAPGISSESTAVAGAPTQVRLTDGERRVLVALCRPMAGPGGTGVPAGNREIADELNLTPDGVKTHVRALFAKLGIEELPQYHKRTELARRALETGLVSQRDLGARP
jgi:pSer/pThr/pTyr-binding forkhead associated (FHA) protein